MSDKPRVIVLGAGSRGTGYADFIARFPDRAEVVAVAEPRDFYRNRVGDAHNLPADRRFKCWTEVVARPRFADAVLICMQDDMHEEPAIACARLGYHILLEKPMAPTAEACQRIVTEVKAAGSIFAVCHVLRYTVFTRRLKQILQSGSIGDIVSIQHLEPVGHWHQAHSFVRGNWRNEKLSSFMLLAKCCHDVDWLRYVMDKPCRKVQSFGSLHHFRPECQPAGAADRCLDCPAEIEKQCPYSAIKIYLRDRIDKGAAYWPVDVLTPNPTAETVKKALREGPYGRCVYKCDNDVVDQQVVNMEFIDGSTAAMTMTAFCNEGGRQTRIFGTRGSLRADSKQIIVTDFLTGETKTIDTDICNDGGILSGHGGGDGGIMDAFLTAVATGDRTPILSGIDETLESHLMVFAAEQSRRTGQVQEL
jgi:predicted dehydrogenase